MTTVTQVEFLLSKRRKKFLDLISDNIDMVDPIGYAIRQNGGTVSDPTVITDADVSTVSDLDALLDVAELRLCRNIKGNLDVVDIKTGPLDEKLSQLVDSLKDDIESLEAYVQTTYGIGGVSVETGVIQLDFVDHNETIIP